MKIDGREVPEAAIECWRFSLDKAADSDLASLTGKLYGNPWALWLVLPPLLYWISRVWMKAHRGKTHDDPVVFAVTDRQSWALALVVGAALWAAHTLSLPL